MAPSFKSKRQLAEELGLSESTLHRRLKLLSIRTTGKRLSPLEQSIIRLAFGFPPPAQLINLLPESSKKLATPDQFGG